MENFKSVKYIIMLYFKIAMAIGNNNDTTNIFLLLIILINYVMDIYIIKNEYSFLYKCENIYGLMFKIYFYYESY